MNIVRNCENIFHHHLQYTTAFTVTVQLAPASDNFVKISNPATLETKRQSHKISNKLFIKS